MLRRRITTLDVNPGNLLWVLTRTYQVMTASLGGMIDPPIDQNGRMCRTLVLRRLQDIVEGTTGVRPDNSTPCSTACRWVPLFLRSLLLLMEWYTVWGETHPTTGSPRRMESSWRSNSQPLPPIHGYNPGTLPTVQLPKDVWHWRPTFNVFYLSGS